MRYDLGFPDPKNKLHLLLLLIIYLLGLQIAMNYFYFKQQNAIKCIPPMGP